MTEKIAKPRCPACHKVQADWVTEAQFTCPRCGLTFTIGALDAYSHLTIRPEGAISINK